MSEELSLSPEHRRLSLPALSDKALEPAFWPSTFLNALTNDWPFVSFVHWLGAHATPARVVQLGLGNGLSVAAFCEAARRTQSSTSVEVFVMRNDVRAEGPASPSRDNLFDFFQSRYPEISRFARETSADALNAVEDGSIDILYVDATAWSGFSEDNLASWIPKISSNGFLLLHRANVRGERAEADRMPKSVAGNFPSFELNYSSTLQVIAIGANAPEFIRKLCDLDSMGRASVTRFFKGLAADAASGSESYSESIGAPSENLALTDERDPVLARLRAELALAGASAEAAELQRRKIEEEHDKNVMDLQSSHAKAEFLISARARTAQFALELQVRANEMERMEARRNLLQHARELQISEFAMRKEAELDKLRSELQLIYRSGWWRFAGRIGTPIGRLRRRLSIKKSGEEQLIEKSGMFDEEHYAASDLARSLGMTPIEHYLRFGESAGLTPSTKFQPTYYSTRYLDVRNYGASYLVHYLRHGIDEGRHPTPTADDSQLWTLSDTALVSESGYFDEVFYAGADQAKKAGISAVDHYLTIGEKAGLAPSAKFDPHYYRLRYPDLAANVPNLLVHYLRHGLSEGRSPISAAYDAVLPPMKRADSRDVIVVLTHEATRSGAPILTWNIVKGLTDKFNVVTVVLRGGGPIQHSLEDASDALVVLPKTFSQNSTENEVLATRIQDAYAPKFVIANSAETRELALGFEKAQIPAILLIHEFSASVRPPGSLHEAFIKVSQIVFSANLVAQSCLDDYDYLAARPIKILPQGQVTPPPALPSSGAEKGDLSVIPSDPDTFVVVGLGTITPRKGVEYFLSTAAAAVARSKRRIFFAWAGGSYEFDRPYLDLLNEQIKRSGLTSDSFAFLGEFANLDALYDRADLCMLSSRLDPLPNTSIDALLRGIPVMCFEQASGIAEILNDHPETRFLVCPYLDTAAAGERVADLANDPAKFRQLSDEVLEIARVSFDMPAYIGQLVDLGYNSAAAIKQMKSDFETIAATGQFNASFYEGWEVSAAENTGVLTKYLNNSRLVAPRGRPKSGLLLRRPMEGFHPLIYAARNESFDDNGPEDPFAHYLKSGCPDGPWRHEMILPQTNPRTPKLRVAIHGHFHYPELFPEFLRRLSVNRLSADLFLTTSGTDNFEILRDHSRHYSRGEVKISKVPNVGRDIGAFLSEYTFEDFAKYDIVGHFHGKRSPHVDRDVGETWRTFIWEHLIGGKYRTGDTILNCFASADDLGLVFPEDPHLNDWDKNRKIGEVLAKKAGISEELPRHLEFPHGTMFWARTQALRPLFDLKLGWSEYPPEPLPIDGTELHALERLIPCVVQHLGFRYETVRVAEYHR